MSDNKTVPTGASVDAFLGAVEHKTRKADSLVLRDLMAAETGLPPVMWGPSIVGYGQYHYKYDSGREGDFFFCGFSPRKANMSLYFTPGYDTYADEIAALGKIRTGASCVYVNKLADIDLDALRHLTRICADYMRTRHAPG